MWMVFCLLTDGGRVHPLPPPSPPAFAMSLRNGRCRDRRGSVNHMAARTADATYAGEKAPDLLALAGAHAAAVKGTPRAR